MLDRRKFIATFALPLVAVPFAVAPQPPRRVPRVGWLSQTSATMEESFREKYRQAMRELGYIEGRTVVTEHRFGDGRTDRLTDLARELVDFPVDVIVTSGTPATLAAKQATQTIPIVFAASADPVGAGVVASLARPGGNVTGLSLMSSDLSRKRLEIMQEALSQFSRASILWDISNPGMALRVEETQTAADLLRVKLLRVGVLGLGELESALAGLPALRPDVVLVTTEPFTIRHRERIVEVLLQYRLPAIFEDRSFVVAGGLMSYGPDIGDNFRQAAGYVDKILKGAKPQDLPVARPSNFELVINLKTANAIGIKLPASLLQRADEVVQ
jgi:putative ABC transport system substrate-binding protein